MPFPAVPTPEANLPPVAPAAPPPGPQSLDPAAIFAGFTRDGYQLREPAANLSGLIGPALCRGTCIEPLILAGDLIYFDPNRPVHHNDIAAIEWLPEVLAKARASDFGREFAERNGGPLSSTSAKLVRYFGRQWYELSNDAAAPIAGNAKLLGPVRKIIRAGRPMWEGHSGLADVALSQLGLNAATLTTYSTAASTTLNNISFTTCVSITLGPFANDCTVVCTAAGTWQSTTGTSSDVVEIASGIAITVGGGQRIVWNPQAGQAASTTMEGSFMLEETFSLLTGTTTTYYLSAIGGGGLPGTTVKILNATMKCEAIKR